MAAAQSPEKKFCNRSFCKTLIRLYASSYNDIIQYVSYHVHIIFSNEEVEGMGLELVGRGGQASDCSNFNIYKCDTTEYF